jgi:GTPase
VSHKTNTTAAARRGAFSEAGAQVVLHDTPGVVTQRSMHGPRHAARVKSAWTTAWQCDLLLFVVDAARQVRESQTDRWTGSHTPDPQAWLPNMD